MRRHSYRFANVAGLIAVLSSILFISACDFEFFSDKDGDSEDEEVLETGVLYGYASGPFSESEFPTYLSIDGLGFFMVTDPEDVSVVYYTRKGDFSVNQQTGAFTSSLGNVVRGWALSRNADTGEVKRVGSVDEIVLTPLARGGVDFSSVTVDEDGIVKARDDSDTLLPLYQIGLASFVDYHGLYALGNDLFEKTGTSGEAVPGIAGDNGFGAIVPFSLEQADPGRFDNLAVSIGGNGYFVVTGSADPWTSYYIDEDALKFNKNGYLVISSGHVVQGWSLVRNSSGEMTVYGPLGDIQLDSFSIYSQEDGPGELILGEIDQKGIVTNSYSNGQVVPLFQIALAGFANPSLLEETAAGLYAETSGSGAPEIGEPNKNGLGRLTFD